MPHAYRACGAIAATVLLLLTPSCRFIDEGSRAFQLINKEEAIDQGLAKSWEALQRSKDAVELAGAWCNGDGEENQREYEALRELNPDLPSIAAACDLVG